MREKTNKKKRNMEGKKKKNNEMKGSGKKLGEKEKKTK
jgi:hypothetical protein